MPLDSTLNRYQQKYKPPLFLSVARTLDKMDRIRQIWIESARSSSTIESTTGCVLPSFQNNSRPPPLRTSSTYDDDDLFNNVALNLLSRHEILGLSVTEAILATLVKSTQRTSFFDGMCVRLDRSSHLSPHTASLVNSLDRIFGKELLDMTTEECKGQPCYTTKPVSPRHTMTFSGAPSCRHDASNGKKKAAATRRFFPDGADKASAVTVPTLGFFGGSKRRVRNIDWSVADAIQQVQCLQLDGFDTSKQSAGIYKAPHM